MRRIRRSRARDGRAISISGLALLKLHATESPRRQAVVDQWIGNSTGIEARLGDCPLPARPRPTSGSAGWAFLGLDAAAPLGVGVDGQTRAVPVGVADVEGVRWAIENGDARAGQPLLPFLEALDRERQQMGRSAGRSLAPELELEHEGRRTGLQPYRMEA